MLDESSPPESEEPTGTSERSLLLMDIENNRLNSITASSNVVSVFFFDKSISQYLVCVLILPFLIVI